MLHLDAGVAFYEEVFTALGRDEELDGSRVHVFRRPREGHGVVEKPCSQLRIEPGRGCYLHYLLVALLHRAIALVEVDHVAVRVGENLDLDVPGPRDRLLHKDGAIAEGGERLASATVEGLDHGGWLIHEAHPAATATGGGLQHHGVPHAGGGLERLRCRADRR